MKNIIEQAPFSSHWNKIGGEVATADSLVGKITTSKGLDYVAKWNRLPIETGEDAVSAATYLKKSLELYEEVIGKEFIVPTDFVIGAKKDGTIMKPKTFIFQPYVEGWTGKTAPESIKSSETVLRQWSTLFERLRILYTTERFENRNLQDGEVAFPVGLTVGTSRRKAFSNERADILPATPNILITPDQRLMLCDFGPYTRWDPRMESIYQRIFDLAKKRKEVTVVKDTIRNTDSSSEYNAGPNPMWEPARQIVEPATIPEGAMEHVGFVTLKPGVEHHIAKKANRVVAVYNMNI